MKKIFLIFAAMCCIMVASAQELDYFSPVGTVGTLNGREAMVVDLGGEIGKVAIATMNVGATSVDDYGTVVDSNEDYDPSAIELTDGWYIPTIDELAALKEIMQTKEDITGLEYKMGKSILTLPGFPKEMNGRTMYVGKYLSSSKPSTRYHSLAFYFVPKAQIQIGDNIGQDFPSVIRPFHKLSTQIFYTTTDEKAIVLDDLVAAMVVSNTYADGQGVLTIGEYMNTIEQKTFNGCEKLSSIEIPALVKKIDNEAFKDCRNLMSVTFAEGSQLVEIGESAFQNTPITFLVLPNKLETIGVRAFRETKLVSVIIPASVTFIGDGAFEDIFEFKSLVVLAEYPPELNGQNVFARFWEQDNEHSTIPCYVTDVNSFKNDVSWKGLNASLEYIDYNKEYKDYAVNVIYTAMKGERYNPDLLEFIADDIAAINNAEDAQTTIELLPNALDKVTEGLKLLESGDLGKFTDANGIKYDVTSEEDKTVEVVANDYSGDVKVPATVTNEGVTYSVTSIGEGAFYECKDLISVTLPEGLKTIGSKAFYFCDNLESITLPEGLKTIGDNAFCSCYDMTSITIPSTVVSIGEGAFFNCNGLTSITIPEGLDSIEGGVFCACDGLTSVTLPEGLKTIGNTAFADCNSLTSITIPSSVTTLREWAFANCDTLASVTLPASLETIEGGVFECCRNLTSITLPQGLKTIGNGAFADCDRLASITIPNSVTSLGAYAFEGCDTLASVILPEGLESIEEETFAYCDDLVSINIPSTVKTIGKWAFDFCSNLASITFPEGLDSIGDIAFCGCTKLTSITIPSTVKSVEGSTFLNCNLSSVSVAEGNTVYDSRDNCNAIIETATNTLIVGSNNTVIPSSVTGIGDYAFSGRHNLMSITIPNGVTKIGEYAFDSCDKLMSITIPGTVTIIDDDAFNSCTNLASVTFSEGLKTIDSYAFYGCAKLTSLVLPNSLESITYCAFIDCTGLKSIIIPSTVKNLGNYAFGWCSGLESITVLAPTPPTLEGKYAFSYVNHDIPVYVPDVDAYSGWDGFTNFVAIELDSYKQAAIAEINSAKEGVVLTAEENDAVNNCIATIENVESQSDENITIIEKAKNEALAIIIPAAIRTARESALAAIEAAMQGETSTYLTGLVQQYIDNINSAADVATITNAKNTALGVLTTAVEAYKVGKNINLGTLKDKQDGPSLIVTDKDGKEVILYSPKKVEYIQVEE